MHDNLLVQYMLRFAGYGNLDGDYWMIGLEEGGGNTVEEIERRLAIWEESGQNQLEDLKHYHDKIGVKRWFGSRAKLQPTWNKLIRIIYGIKDLSPQTDDIREYQRTQLGRFNGETCLTELMPLPSPSSNHWLYADISALPELKSRKSYLHHWAPIRFHMLSKLISKNRPKFVVYYGMGYYQDWWSQLMPANHKTIHIDGVKAYLGENEGAVFAVSPHPVATGVKNTFFHELGRAMSVV